MKNFKDNVTVLPIIGKTVTSIEGLEKGSDEIIFHCSDGSHYKMYHEQDCCESVTVDDISGNINCLVGEPLLKAEEFTRVPDEEECNNNCLWDSVTFTFYNFATIKGYVQIKWFGESNGYYSEEVDFEQTYYNVSKKDKEIFKTIKKHLCDVDNHLVPLVSKNNKYKDFMKLMRSNMAEIREAMDNIIYHSSILYNKCDHCKSEIDKVIIRDLKYYTPEEIRINETIKGIILREQGKEGLIKALSGEIDVTDKIPDQILYMNEKNKIRNTDVNEYLKKYLTDGVLFNRPRFEDDYDSLIEAKIIGVFCPECGSPIEMDDYEELIEDFIDYEE